MLGLALAVGAGASFAGPAGAWLVAGTGLFIVVLGYAPTRAGIRRA